MDDHYQKFERQLEIEWMLQSSQIDDAGLMEALIRAYSHRLFYLAFFILDDLPAAREVVSEVILLLVKNRHRYDGEHRLGIWLYAMTNKIAQTKIRRVRSIKFMQKLSGQEQQKGFVNSAADSSQRSFAFLKALPAEDRLLLLLQKKFELNLDEIAYIIQGLPFTLHRRFTRSRNLLLAQPAVRQRLKEGGKAGENFTWADPILEELFIEAQPPHSIAREQVQAVLVGNVDYEATAQMESHLLSCPSCKNYSTALAIFDKWLSRNIKEAWVEKQLEESEIQALLAGLDRQRRERRGLSSHFREISLGLSVIFLAVVLGWYGRVAHAEPQSTVIVLATHVATRVVKNTPHPESTPSPQKQEPIPQTGETDKMSGLSPLPARTLLHIDMLGITHSAVRESLELLNTGPVGMAFIFDYWGLSHDLEPVIEQFQRHLPSEQIMLEDLFDAVQRRPGIGALYATGGSLGELKKLLAEGYPVIVQKSSGNSTMPEDSGYIETIYGYDDHYGVFWLLTPALFEKEAGFMQYGEFIQHWQAFDNHYLVVYPVSEEYKLLRLLGIKASETDREQTSH